MMSLENAVPPAARFLGEFERVGFSSNWNDRPPCDGNSSSPVNTSFTIQPVVHHAARMALPRQAKSAALRAELPARRRP
jgi:hypothetical protein